MEFCKSVSVFIMWYFLFVCLFMRIWVLFVLCTVVTLLEQVFCIEEVSKCSVDINIGLQWFLPVCFPAQFFHLFTTWVVFLLHFFTLLEPPIFSVKHTSPTLQKRLKASDGNFFNLSLQTQKLLFASIFSYFSIVTIEVLLFDLGQVLQFLLCIPSLPVISGTAVILVKIMVVPVTDKPRKHIGLTKHIYFLLRSNSVGKMGWGLKLFCSLQTQANVGSFVFNMWFPVFPWASRPGKERRWCLESLYGSDLEMDQHPDTWPLLTIQESEKGVLFACPTRKEMANV